MQAMRAREAAAGEGGKRKTAAGKSLQSCFHPGDELMLPQYSSRYEVMSWVGENCLSLVELVNICQFCPTYQSQTATAGRAEVNQRDSEEGEKKTLPTFCLWVQITKRGRRNCAKL